MNKAITSRFKNKYMLSRRGKKLNIFEDSKIITVLPKDIPERTWAEILQKEENDLMIFDIREELLVTALNIGYQHYMERQSISFTVHCTMKAWLKIIDWYFYRHDPGEDVSAFPPCFIPKREASWQADVPPEPSPRDPFCRQRLDVQEDETKESIREAYSSTSLEYPVIEEIPSECWFPGRVNMKQSAEASSVDGSQNYGSGTSTLYTTDEDLAAESELLQKVTEYSSDKTLKEDSSAKLLLPRVDRSSVTVDSGEVCAKSQSTRRSPATPSPRPSQTIRSRGTLAPLSSASLSPLSIISDCRLRNLRLDTQYEVSSEKIDLSPVENVKRK